MITSKLQYNNCFNLSLARKNKPKPKYMHHIKPKQSMLGVRMHDGVWLDLYCTGSTVPKLTLSHFRWGVANTHQFWQFVCSFHGIHTWMWLLCVIPNNHNISLCACMYFGFVYKINSVYTTELKCKQNLCSQARVISKYFFLPGWTTTFQTFNYDIFT